MCWCYYDGDVASDLVFLYIFDESSPTEEAEDVEYIEFDDVFDVDAVAQVHDVYYIVVS